MYRRTFKSSVFTTTKTAKITWIHDLAPFLATWVEDDLSLKFPAANLVTPLHPAAAAQA